MTEAIERMLASPAASYWLKNAARTALQRDPVDALHDAEALVVMLRGNLGQVQAGLFDGPHQHAPQHALKWYVECEVYGGVTGRRVSLMKGMDGNPQGFETEAEAQAAAARCRTSVKDHHGPASFAYRVVQRRLP
jgi:hypothetical protein